MPELVDAHDAGRDGELVDLGLRLVQDEVHRRDRNQAAVSVSVELEERPEQVALDGVAHEARRPLQARRDRDVALRLGQRAIAAALADLDIDRRAEHGLADGRVASLDQRLPHRAAALRLDAQHLDVRLALEHADAVRRQVVERLVQRVGDVGGCGLIGQPTDEARIARDLRARQPELRDPRLHPPRSDACEQKAARRRVVRQDLRNVHDVLVPRERQSEHAIDDRVVDGDVELARAGGSDSVVVQVELELIAEPEPARRQPHDIVRPHHVAAR